MSDWADYDVARISETDFPIWCERCGHALTGWGDTGRCSACERPFDRRRLLWERYGPEAFADPPVLPGGEGSATGDAFIFVLLTIVALILPIPAVLLASRALFGAFNLLFAFFAYLVFAISLEWILYRRWADRPTRPPQPKGSDDK